jgi:hypothetical protein
MGMGQAPKKSQGLLFQQPLLMQLTVLRYGGAGDCGHVQQSASGD